MARSLICCCTGPVSTDPILTAETFRALARSAPWRWSTLEIQVTRRCQQGGRVHAWMRRDDRMRVDLPDGEVILDHGSWQTYVSADLVAFEDDEVTDVAALRAPALTDTGAPSATDDTGAVTKPVRPLSTEPAFGPDGLVRRRPGASEDTQAPMYQDYQWVAMLDPWELADGQAPETAHPSEDPPLGVDIHRLEVSQRHGRVTWWAEVTPTADYDPQCSCCPLLAGEVSDRLEGLADDTRADRPAEAGAFGYATAYLVGLDLQTGVCVSLDHLDGAEVGNHVDVRILAVNQPMPDTLFPRRPRWRRLRRRR